MRGLLLDVWNNVVREEDPQDLDDYYKILRCDTIDIKERRVGNEKLPFSIVCDDNGLFEKDIRISATNNDNDLMFVGSIFVTGPWDGEESMMALEQVQVDYLMKYIKTAIRADGVRNPVLTCCNY